MNDNNVIIIIVVVAVILIVGGVFLAANLDSSPEVDANSEARAVVEISQHDWGTIKLNDPDVEKTFTIRNEGSQILQLFNVSTSCTCTTARLSLGAEQSPLFGMHTKSSYVLDVPPGETVELNVIFDPDFHGPSGVGLISRQVMIETNDVQQPELVFNLTVNVER